MKNRAQALSLLTELRGRLDELEQMICLSPDFVVLSPAIYDEPGVEVLTPSGYLTFRQTPPAPPQTRKAYEPFGGFLQIGAPGTDVTAICESFALSDLHRGAEEEATGLRLVPQGVAEADRSRWFTYELLADPITLSDWDWVEWVVKLSCQAPLHLKPQVLVDQGGKPSRIALADFWSNSFATFQQFRLDPGQVQPPAESSPLTLEKPVRLRLIFGTSGGEAQPLTLYQFALYGKRRPLKGDRPAPPL